MVTHLEVVFVGDLTVFSIDEDPVETTSAQDGLDERTTGEAGVSPLSRCRRACGILRT